MKEETSVVRTLIAEDHALVRQGLRLMLASEPDIEVVGEAENGQEVLELCRELAPDLVLMDVRMPQMDGLEATRTIKGEFPTTSVVMVTSQENPDYLLDAVRAGAAGYVLKEATKDELLDSVRKVASGEPTLDQALAMRLLKRVADETNGHTKKPPGLEPPRKRQNPLAQPPPGPLSAREVEVLRLLALGRTNREIGQTLM